MSRDPQTIDRFSPDGWLDFFLINALTILVLGLFFWGSGCGIGGGNPCDRPGGTCEAGVATSSDGSPELSPADKAAAAHFEDPITEYYASTLDQQPNGVDCGAFTNSSELGAVTAGRQCIRDALTACRPAKYLLDQRNTLVSFVSVVPTSAKDCELHVHTVSNDSSMFVGDKKASCAKITVQEMPELACGIAG